MRNFVIGLVLIVVAPVVYGQEELKWVKDIDKGIEMGRSMGKDVIIYFGEDNCVPCRMIEKYAFVQPEFIQYSEKFVMVKIYNDKDKSKTMEQEYIKEARKRYEITAVPTMVLLKQDGSQSSFFTYIKNPQELIDQIESHYN